MEEKNRPESPKKAITRRKKSEEEGSESEKKPIFQKEKKLFKYRSFSRQYQSFRKGGLGILDSFFNSFYIYLSERSIEKEEKRLAKSGNTKPNSRHLMDFHGPLLRVFSWIFSGFRKAGKAFPAPWKKSGDGRSHRSVHRFPRKNLTYYLAGALFCFVVFYIAFTLSSPVVLRAEINGKVVGIVENKNVLDSAINELEDNVEIVLGESFHFPYEVRYTFRRQHGAEVTPKNKITEQLYSYILDSICTAGGLYVDDQLVAVCRDADTVQAGIDEFVSRNHQGAESGIFNDIRIVTQAYPTDSIITQPQLARLLEEMSKPLEEREKAPLPENTPKGETEKEEDTPAMVLLSDTQLLPEENKVSHSNRPVSIDHIKIDFYNLQEVSYRASIPFDTVYQESAQHYTTMADETVRGVNGVSDVTARIYYVNGKEARREIISETVISEPKTRVISIGTKVLPEDQGINSFYSSYGRLIVPRVAPVYSYFGDREDGFHRAWDIPGHDGDNIYAAASGEVVCVIGQFGAFPDRPLNYFTTYGYCIILRHDNGFSTMYAHCSKVNVTLGQKVKQGEKIAEVGDTGNTTGSHVHFEVRINDVRVDPALYMYNGNKTIYN